MLAVAIVYKGLWSGIWGHWVVDFDEPDCETSWVNFTDEVGLRTTPKLAYRNEFCRVVNRPLADAWVISHVGMISLIKTGFNLAINGNFGSL